MTIPRDFPRDTADVHESTDRLLVSLDKLDDDAVGEPSLLPGWTRGHVLAHLARNADALVNLLTWARTGVRCAGWPRSNCTTSTSASATPSSSCRPPSSTASWPSSPR